MARATDTQGRPARSRKRLILLLVWLCGVSLVWWKLVLPVPERVIRHEKDLHLAGHTASGALVFAHHRRIDEWFFQFVGPVQTIDAKSGNIVSEFGTDHDRPYLVMPGVDSLVLLSGDRLRVVHIPTGRTVFERPSAGRLQFVTISDDGELLALEESRRITVYQISTGALLWTREFRLDEEVAKLPQRVGPGELQVLFQAQFRQFIGIDLSIHETGSQMSSRLKTPWFNARTGKPEFRFGESDQVIQSPDGRHVAFNSDDDCVLFSMTENREVCRFPFEAGYCKFSPDSTELWLFSPLESGIPMTRCDVATGKLLGPVPPVKQTGWRPITLDPIISHDGRRIAIDEQLLPLEIPQFIRGILSANAFLKSSLLDRLEAIRSSVVVRDADGSHPTIIDYERFWSNRDSIPQPRSIGSPDCFAVELPGEVRIYRFDPPRNWRWLFTWALGPPLLIMALARLRTAVARRLRRLHSPPEKLC